MDELQRKLGVLNSDWLMSSREKLSLIGLLHTLKPKRVLEFGYHRGGATQWLSKLSDQVITVDVNEFVLDAENQYQNVESWRCSTLDAIEKIKDQNLFFDLTIIDADHTRVAVTNDINGVLQSSDIIIMHDSFNPACRKGMITSLKKQQTHAYYLDFMPSLNKHDGLWGGLAIAWRSEKPGQKKEFKSEYSPFTPIVTHHFLRISPYLQSLKIKILTVLNIAKNRLRIGIGKILGR
jgi:predicted O-methyltransferase YrrM